MTGGGTAGHVIPNIALIDELKRDGYEIVYIGSKNGIEKKLITAEGIRYIPISTGKLRRYFSWENFTDFFRVIAGIFQSIHIIRKEKPNIIFSKGGFVSVPVVIGGFFNRRNILVHESDLSIGLANKIASKFAKKVLTSFEKTVTLFPSKKAIYTGSPIRKSLSQGDRKKALAFTGLKDDKPFIFLTGGSLGSKALNTALRNNLEELSKDFNIIHQCGKGNIDKALTTSNAADKDKKPSIPNYVQYEFIGEELADIFALSDLVISRAGANTIFELLNLNKPNLLIPLSRSASRGDQIDNAGVFAKKGFSKVLFEEDLTDENFLTFIRETYEDKDELISKMQEASKNIGNKKIIEIIKKYTSI